MGLRCCPSSEGLGPTWASGERGRIPCCCGYSGDDSEVLPAITPPCPVFQDAAGLNYLMELRFFSRRTSKTHSGVGLSIDGQIKSPTEEKERGKRELVCSAPVCSASAPG